MLSFFFSVFFALCTSFACGLSFPPQPSGVTTLESKLRPGVTISYKQTHICETTPGVNSYSGYIHLDALTIGQSYNASVFFWYFEARNDPRNAPLTIYLAGGPGTSSLTAAAYEGGPCYVNDDSNSTTLNPWSMNNNVNMLYIDQPVSTGFSYNSLVNSTLNFLTQEILPIDPQNGTIEESPVLVTGTLPDQSIANTANNSVWAAKALWQFSQVWFGEFPEYNTTDDRISVWGNSYGGFYAPATVSYFQMQNEKIKNNTAGYENSVYLNIDALGITNGCVDGEFFMQSFPEYAYNNTYGFQGVSEEIYEELMMNMTKSGGCNDLIKQCRDLAAVGDPLELGNNATVNDACAASTAYCMTYVQGAFQAVSGRNAFDISRDALAAFPPEYPSGFFNQRWVQEDLGVPVNFTLSANQLITAFFLQTGDATRRSIAPLNSVAQSGVKIALVFGDRDYRCNWLGGEATSLALQYPEAEQFRSAGYQSISVNASYQGGFVRQYNNVSFSRVFEAGHAVSAFQPETVWQIFNRVTFNKDVATGNSSTIVGSSNSTAKGYSSTGPASTFDVKNKLPESPKNECYTWAAQITCTDEELLALQNGTAIIKNYIVIGIQGGNGSTGENGTAGAPSTQPSGAVKGFQTGWVLALAGITGAMMLAM